MLANQNSQEKPVPAWKSNGNFVKSDDDMIDLLVSELNSLGLNMAVKDEKIRHLSTLASRVQVLNNNLQRQVDVCVGMMAQLKTAESMDEVNALLKRYEIEEHTIPFIN